MSVRTAIVKAYRRHWLSDGWNAISTLRLLFLKELSYQILRLIENMNLKPERPAHRPRWNLLPLSSTTGLPRFQLWP
jgi:hypothetical protein